MLFRSVGHVLASMPSRLLIERRDRALIAFVLISGCRDRAVVSLKLKHVDLERGLVFQDAREVQTKFGKTITTFFFPVGDLASQIVTDWIAELQTEHLWGPDDPLFPSTLMAQDEDREFRAVGLERRHWSTAGPVRRIFEAAFTSAGLLYFHPHSFRHTLGQLGQRLCRTPEEMKAWSQNLGHEQMLTTLTSYGHVEDHRQGEIIQDLSRSRATDGSERRVLDEIIRLANRS